VLDRIPRNGKQKV